MYLPSQPFGETGASGKSLLRASSGSGLPARGKAAFTIMEMLIVIFIIGIIAGLVAPVFRNWNSGDAIAAANRQLMDDLGLARSLALSTRSTVYVVFVPSNIYTFGYPSAGVNLGQYKNLLGKPYTTYALYSDRAIGDQPGARTPRYLTDWKTLPERTCILPEDFISGALVETNSVTFPFPTATGYLKVLPYVGFNSRGQLLPAAADNVSKDLLIHITSGIVSAARDPVTGEFLPKPVIFSESPANFSLFSQNAIHINWLTGRSNVQRLEVGNTVSGGGVGAK